MKEVLYLKLKRDKAAHGLSYNCKDVVHSFSLCPFLCYMSFRKSSLLIRVETSEWLFSQVDRIVLSGSETPQSHLLCLWDVGGVGRVSGHRQMRWDLCGGIDGSGSTERWWVDCQIYSKEAGFSEKQVDNTLFKWMSLWIIHEEHLGYFWDHLTINM